MAPCFVLCPCSVAHAHRPAWRHQSPQVRPRPHGSRTHAPSLRARSRAGLCGLSVQTWPPDPTRASRDTAGTWEMAQDRWREWAGPPARQGLGTRYPAARDARAQARPQRPRPSPLLPCRVEATSKGRWLTRRPKSFIKKSQTSLCGSRHGHGRFSFPQIPELTLKRNI